MQRRAHCRLSAAVLTNTNTAHACPLGSRTILPSLAAAAALFTLEERFAALLAVAVEELVAKNGLGVLFSRGVEGDGERDAGADGGCGDAERLEC
jgi:hypothetical protein